MQKNATDLNI